MKPLFHVYLFAMSVLALFQLLPAEILPASSLGDWSTAGVEGGIPDYSVAVNVKDFGVEGDGTTDDVAAIREAIDSCPAGSAVYFPEGTYLTTSTITVTKSIVLRGAGPDLTRIIHAHSGDAIRMESGSDRAGIEELHIETVYPFTGISGCKISFLNTRNSWIRNIETSGYIGHVISLEQSSYCEVRDSYFHNGVEMTNEELEQTSAYGIEIYGSGEGAFFNLVENNVLDWMRHAMILQWRSHFNVYAYNFAWNSWSCNQNGCGFSFTTDFELHHYDYDGDPPSHFINYTLIEGNLFEQGGSGSHTNNTWFRNRVNNGGIMVKSDNFAIGNEFVEKKNPGIWNPGADDNNSIRNVNDGSIAHGNFITVPPEGLTWDPDISDHDIPDSYYLTSRPSFFGDLDWPPYGGDLMPGNKRRSPAEVRYWSMLFPEVSPSNLQIDVRNDDIVLTWDNNSTNDVDFIICRSSDNSDYHRIGYTNETSYTDTPSTEEQYYYYVRARNHLGGRNHDGELNGIDLGGESAPSNRVSNGSFCIRTMIPENRLHTLIMYGNHLGRGEVRFYSSQPGMVTLTDLNGRCIAVMKAAAGENRLKVSTGKGVFWLHFIGKENNVAKKIVAF